MRLVISRVTLKRLKTEHVSFKVDKKTIKMYVFLYQPKRKTGWTNSTKKSDLQLNTTVITLNVNHLKAPIKYYQ